MIQTLNLQYSYPGRNPLKFPDLVCRPSQQLLITGPSGSGKTTLLHLLAGLRMPQSGEVIIQDQSLTQLKPSRLNRFRGQHIGLVFQQMHFIGSLNVVENLLLQQYLAGVPQDKKRAYRLLERLHLADKAHQNIRKLSLGEQQRVALARAIINKPTVVLADEPTSSLDDANCRRVAALFEEMASTENSALVIVTHDQRLKDLIPKQIAL